MHDDIGNRSIVVMYKCTYNIARSGAFSKALNDVKYVSAHFLTNHRSIQSIVEI